MEKSLIPFGFCQCGCGLRTRIAAKNDTTANMVKGQPMRYLPGHWIKNRKGANAPKWKGGRTIDKDGYVMIRKPGYKASRHGYVYEHILVVEEHMGSSLPKGAVVHHKDSNKLNNSLDNLQIMESQSAHMELHMSLTALAECGHRDWRKCHICHTYDAPENLVRKTTKSHYHKKCAGIRTAERRRNTK